MAELERIVVLIGPTASGKTAAAIALSQRLPLEIVNFDASQFYEGMVFGTAAPTVQEMALAPHHLYGFRSPEQPLNVGEYVRLADDKVVEIRGRGGFPLFVGGTGLYVRALTRGLAAIPDISAEVRAAVRERMAGLGAVRLHEELVRVDPEAASRIAPGDPQRISRALEVFGQTGRPISWYQARHRFAAPRYRDLRIGLQREAGELRERVTRRVPEMLRNGFLEEVRTLLQQGRDFSQRTFKALGYREVAAHLRGEISLEEATARLTTLHLRYAKRQATWFRKEPDIHWFSPDDLDGMSNLARGFLGHATQQPFST